MATLNEVRLIGHLGKDPDYRVIGPNGRATASIRLAVTKRWRPQGGGEVKSKTSWFTCVLWGQQAEFAHKYLRKGHPVFVSGELDTREWEDKNGGGKRTVTEVQVSNIQSLAPREKESGGADDFPEPPPLSDDDLPF